MKKPDLLLLTHRIPYPPNKGDKIRSWFLLKNLCENWTVHLGCFVDDPDDLQHVEFLQNMTASSVIVEIDPGRAKLKSLTGLLSGEALSLTFYRSKKMSDFVAQVRAANDIKVQMAFSSGVAPFLMPSEIPTVIDFCDSDAEKWRAYGQQRKGLGAFIYGREANILARKEREFQNQASHSFAITKAEADIFNDREGVETRVDYWENGVDTHYYDPDADFENADVGRNDLVFVGAMDYAPNIEGVSWFCETIWPSLKQRYPALTFAIVGSKPTRKVEQLGQLDGVKVTGRVEDVRPWLQSAKLVVTPLLVARGIQNKVLEAMAMAKPVISSQAAATGIHALVREEICVTQNGEDMISQIAEFLENPDKAAKIGHAARQRVVRDYSWPAKLERLDKCLHGLIER